MFKRNWHWALAVLIILGIGSFLVFRPKAQVGTVTVYKTVTPAPKQAQTDTADPVSSADVQMQSLSADTKDIASSVPDTIETHPIGKTATSEGARKASEVSEEATVSAEEAEELQYGDYTKEELTQIKEWGEDLRERLLTEYADLKEIADMTPEQIAEKYPTDEDRQRLAERGKKFFEEYLEETRALFVSLPGPVREKAFEQIHSELSKSWGRGAADQLLGQLVELMK